MNASVRLLGAPRVAVGGVVHEPVASRASGLLYFLARSGEWTSRGDLCYLLWPDKTQELSQTSLRQLIHTVRDLPYAGELEVERERLRWQAETDLPATADLSNGPVWGPTEYQQAPRFMAGFWLRKAPEFDSWLEAERDHWEARLRDDLVTSVDRSLAVGDADGALSMLAGWLRHQPLDHELVERVLSICRDVGRFEEGERRFSEFSAALHRELGLKPSLTVLRAHAALSELAAEGAAREDGSVAVAIAAPPAGPVTLGSSEHTGATDLTRLTVPLRFRRTRFFGSEDVAMAERQFDLVIADVLAALA